MFQKKQESIDYSNYADRGQDRPLKKRKQGKKRFYQRVWFKITIALVLTLLAVGVGFAYKTGYVLNKISESDNSTLKSLFGVLPMIGIGDEIKQEDGRVNVLVLGMRGENIPGGGLLADTIMVLSLKKDDNKVAMISVPRDLYVKIPDTERRVKINAVHAYGEEAGKKEGLKEMKRVVEEVTGQPIHYAVSMNFTGFKQLIDAVGGIDVYLETAFYETSQFVEGKECGIEFTLPAGVNHLDGETALCYARARENTSDFDRSKRQQVMIKSLKDKLLSVGTLSDFGKLNGILDAVGNNVRTDMASYEMKKFFEDYSALSNAQIYQRVFENSEEGLLKVPEDAPEGAGYILIPRMGWDDYSQVHEVCGGIFDLPPQSDIQPVKQYTRPQAKTTEEDDKDAKDKKKSKSDDDDKKDEDEDEDEDKDKE